MEIPSATKTAVPCLFLCHTALVGRLIQLLCARSRLLPVKKQIHRQKQENIQSASQPTRQTKSPTQTRNEHLKDRIKASVRLNMREPFPCTRITNVFVAHERRKQTFKNRRKNSGDSHCERTLLTSSVLVYEANPPPIH